MTAVDHIGIAVHNLATAVRRYESLGLTAAPIETVPAESVRIAVLQAGDCRIELLEPTAEDSTIGRFLAGKGEGLHHIALGVDNIDEVYERMKHEGARIASSGIQSGAGYRYFFLHPSESNGVLIEICQDVQTGGV